MIGVNINAPGSPARAGGYTRAAKQAAKTGQRAEGISKWQYLPKRSRR